MHKMYTVLCTPWGNGIYEFVGRVFGAYNSTIVIDSTLPKSSGS